MKRFVALLLTVAIVFELFGCSAPAEPVDDAIHFYYPKAEFYLSESEIDFFSENGIIGQENRQVSHQTEPEYLINLYLRGPQSPELISPFPDQVTVINTNLNNNSLHLIMSPQFSTLTDIDLTIACSCLVKTCTELYASEQDIQLNSIRISTAGYPTGGAQWLDFNPNNLLVFDNSVALLRDSLSLYLTDPRHKTLHERPVTINLTSGNSTCNELINQLLVPSDKSLYSPVPDGTLSQGVTVNDGICAVNLSSEFTDRMAADSTAQYLALQSITNTMTQLNYVKGVTFYCEGIRLTKYGALDTSEPWVWDNRCILPEPLPENYHFAALCLPTNGTTLVPLYFATVSVESLSPVEQLLNKLFYYEPANGFRNPIPKGTRVLRITETDEHYTIELSPEFLSNPDSLELAIRCVAASVYSLPHVKSVQIIVAGKNAEKYTSYFIPQVPSSDWYA